MDTLNLKVSAPGTVKAVRDGDEYKLRVLGAPFGSPEDLDKDGEYFSKRTDFALETGDARPVMYMHGLAPNGKKMTNPDVLGRAVAAEPDDHGLWFDTTLDVTKPLGKRLWDKAEQGLVRASTGAVAHLFRKAGDGEILKWVIGELSLLDVGLGRHPSNEKAVAVALKSVYQEAEMEYPEALSEAEKAVDQAAVDQVPQDAAPQDAPQELDVPALVAAVVEAVLAEADGGTPYPAAVADAVVAAVEGEVGTSAPDMSAQDTMPKADTLAEAVVAWYDAQERMYSLAMGDTPAEEPVDAGTAPAAP